jgi:hypothetical protein
MRLTLKTVFKVTNIYRIRQRRHFTVWSKAVFLGATLCLISIWQMTFWWNLFRPKFQIANSSKMEHLFFFTKFWSFRFICFCTPPKPCSVYSGTFSLAFVRVDVRTIWRARVSLSHHSKSTTDMVTKSAKSSKLSNVNETSDFLYNRKVF